MSSSGLKSTIFSVEHLPLLIFISFKFSTKPAIAYTHCWAIVLFFRPSGSVGKDILFGKFWLVSAGATCQCVWLYALAFPSQYYFVQHLF
jgi:hypothetical protein